MLKYLEVGHAYTLTTRKEPAPSLTLRCTMYGVLGRKLVKSIKLSSLKVFV